MSTPDDVAKEVIDQAAADKAAADEAAADQVAADQAAAEKAEADKATADKAAADQAAADKIAADKAASDKALADLTAERDTFKTERDALTESDAVGHPRAVRRHDLAPRSVAAGQRLPDRGRGDPGTAPLGRHVRVRRVEPRHVGADHAQRP